MQVPTRCTMQAHTWCNHRHYASTYTMQAPTQYTKHICQQWQNLTFSTHTPGSTRTHKTRATGIYKCMDIYLPRSPTVDRQLLFLNPLGKIALQPPRVLLPDLIRYGLHTHEHTQTGHMYVCIYIQVYMYTCVYMYMNIHIYELKT